MNYIVPMLKPLNSGDYYDWLINHSENRDRYDTFVKNAIETGLTEEQAMKKWEHNFGVIPKIMPERFYHCVLVASKIKMVVTVLKRENPTINQREYEVVKLNKLLLDTYNYSREMDRDEKGNIIFRMIPQDLHIYEDDGFDNVEETHKEIKKQNLSFNEENVWKVLTTSPLTVIDGEGIFTQSKDNFVTEDSMYLEYFIKEPVPAVRNYALNYEDSQWFSIMDINQLLRRFKIKITPYQFPAGWLKPDPTPKAFIQNMDFIEIVDFEIEDKEFEQKLFNLVNISFKNNLKK